MPSIHTASTFPGTRFLPTKVCVGKSPTNTLHNLTVAYRLLNTKPMPHGNKVNALYLFWFIIPWVDLVIFFMQDRFPDINVLSCQFR